MRARRLTGTALALVVLAAAIWGGVALAGGSAARTSGAASSSGAGGVRASVLRIGTVNYIDSLNPFNWIEAQSDNAMIMIYPQLVQYGPGLKIQGDWATSWKTSADGKDWTFKLHPNTKWSDGQPMTAADAAWTINTTLKYANGADGARRAGARPTSRRPPPSTRRRS